MFGLIAFTDKKNWSEANAHCESLGGHLAVIRNADDNTAVTAALNAAGAEGPSWIALNDIDEEGYYEWELGPLHSFDLPLGDYHPWAAGHPQTDATCGLAYCDCADILLGSGNWRIRACDQLKTFACVCLLINARTHLAALPASARTPSQPSPDRTAAGHGTPSFLKRIFAMTVTREFAMVDEADPEVHKVVYLVDMSFSMLGKSGAQMLANGIRGLKEKAAPDKTTLVDVVYFAFDAVKVLQGKDLAKLDDPLLSGLVRMYKPSGGTAYMDSLAAEIKTLMADAELHDRKPAWKTAMIYIITDGLDNQSKISREELRCLIGEAENYSVLPVLIGGGAADAMGDGASIGIPKERNLQYLESASGFKAAYDAAASLATRVQEAWALEGMPIYRSAAFTDEERMASQQPDSFEAPASSKRSLEQIAESQDEEEAPVYRSWNGRPSGEAEEPRFRSLPVA